jgi:hypothetical protein
MALRTLKKIEEIFDFARSPLWRETQVFGSAHSKSVVRSRLPRLLKAGAKQTAHRFIERLAGAADLQIEKVGQIVIDGKHL